MPSVNTRTFGFGVIAGGRSPGKKSIEKCGLVDISLSEPP